LTGKLPIRCTSIRCHQSRSQRNQSGNPLKISPKLFRQTEPPLWSAENWPRNLARLYNRLTDYKNRDWQKLEEVGGRPFRAVIFRDRNPQYDLNFKNGLLEYTNQNTLVLKRVFREKTSLKYSIHSSADSKEAARNTTLLLGPDAFEKLLTNQPAIRSDPRPLLADMAGANGWHDYRTMFLTLTLTVPHVVIKHHGSFPEPIPADDLADVVERLDDIDILTNDLISAVNVLKPDRYNFVPHRHKVVCFLKVSGGWVKLDIKDQRGALPDSAWSQAMLDTRVIIDDYLTVPNHNHGLLSLLYFGLVGDKLKRITYRNSLWKICHSVNGGTEIWALIDEPKNLINLLNGLFQNQGYAVRLHAHRAQDNSKLATTGHEEKGKNRFQGHLFDAMLRRPEHVGGPVRDQIFFSWIWRTNELNGSDTALKVVYSVKEEMRPILMREHIFLQQLDDRRFAKCLDFGEIFDAYYVVTEWITGKRLSEIYLRPEHSAEDALLCEKISDEAADILKRLASVGIRHRDIRPHNCFLTERGLVLFDFGWASFFDENDGPIKEKFRTADDARDMAIVIDQITLPFEARK
jgi:hypothetical protein